MEVDIRLGGLYKSFNDFYVEYKPYFTKLIVSFGFRKTHEINDTLQDLFSDFYEGKKGKSYFELYDPSRAKFKTLVTNFAIKRLLNRWTRRKRTAGRFISLDVQLEKGDDFEGLLGVEVGVEERGVEFSLLCDKIREEIKACYPNRRGLVPSTYRCKKCDYEIDSQSAVKVCAVCNNNSWYPCMYGKETIERSHLSVFEMLLLGYARREIAKILKYAEPTISLFVRDLAELPSVVRMWDQCHDLEEKWERQVVRSA